MTFTYTGTTGNDNYRYTGSDSVEVSGKAGNDTLTGSTNNDTLYGGRGNDIMYGYFGTDTLVGGAGNDILSGFGGGNDTFTGGAGSDTFVLGSSSTSYFAGNSYVTITDYEREQSDKIQIGRNTNIRDYFIDNSRNYSGASALDQAIFYRGDLIAIVQDTADMLDVVLF